MSAPKFFDTHAHINFDDFKNDSQEVIERALKNNVWLMNVGSQASTSKRAVEMAEGVCPHTKFSVGVYAAVGLHPLYAEDENFDEKFYLELAKNEKVLAIGECGLDYYRLKQGVNREAQIAKQKEVFIKHIELANKIKKPLIIHCREAHEDMIEILSKFYSPILRPVDGINFPTGVMHYFGGVGAWENVKKYLEMGFYISFSGVVTFLKYSHNEDIKKLPLERILIETDSPYATPVPYRGQRNEPSYVIEVAKKIAEIKNISFDEVARKTAENAAVVFGLKI